MGNSIVKRGALGALLDEHNSIESFEVPTKTKKKKLVVETATPKAIKDEPNKPILIDTSDCKPWKYADRDDPEMGSIEELANAIKANGQQVPALLRPVKSADGDTKYEVVYGHRRWLACKLIKSPILAFIKDIDDQDAALAQKEENENRQDLSPYKKALNYKKLLDNKIFTSQRELAAHLNIPKSNLNQLMAYTKIPDELIHSLKHPHKLPIKTAETLATICKDISKSDLQKLCEHANEILTGRIPAKKIQSIFEEDQSEKITTTANTKRIYKNSYGTPLFTSTQNQNKSDIFVFHRVIRDNKLLEKLEQVVFDFLKESETPNNQD